MGKCIKKKYYIMVIFLFLGIVYYETDRRVFMKQRVSRHNDWENTREKRLKEDSLFGIQSENELHSSATIEKIDADENYVFPSYDVDGLPVFIHDITKDTDSAIYIQKSGKRIDAKFCRVSYKWGDDSLRRYQVRRLYEKISYADETAITLVYILFERFRVKEVRFASHVKPDYENIVKEIIKESERDWKLPPCNDSIPIVTIIPYYFKLY